MAENFRRELRKFDRERALPAWDGLLTKQQSALFDLGVPTMFVTNLKADREVKLFYALSNPAIFLRFSETTKSNAGIRRHGILREAASGQRLSLLSWQFSSWVFCWNACVMHYPLADMLQCRPSDHP